MNGCIGCTQKVSSHHRAYWHLPHIKKVLQHSDLSHVPLDQENVLKTETPKNDERAKGRKTNLYRGGLKNGSLCHRVTCK